MVGRTGVLLVFGANEGNFGITIDCAVFEDCIGTDISFNELDQLGYDLE